MCSSRELVVGNLSGEETGVQILSPGGLGNFLQARASDKHGGKGG